ncbi:hypothetical protein C8R45DRAFT_921723 [Mycena sanguinolenta]|nr:hypothetical protein C8R45DRAFT_921723 [Mycena sanguinolenta]
MTMKGIRPGKRAHDARTYVADDRCITLGEKPPRRGALQSLHLASHLRPRPHPAPILAPAAGGSVRSRWKQSRLEKDAEDADATMVDSIFINGDPGNVSGAIVEAREHPQGAKGSWIGQERKEEKESRAFAVSSRLTWRGAWEAFQASARSSLHFCANLPGPTAPAPPRPEGKETGLAIFAPVQACPAASDVAQVPATLEGVGMRARGTKGRREGEAMIENEKRGKKEEENGGVPSGRESGRWQLQKIVWVHRVTKDRKRRETPLQGRSEAGQRKEHYIPFVYRWNLRCSFQKRAAKLRLYDSGFEGGQRHYGEHKEIIRGPCATPQDTLLGAGSNFEQDMELRRKTHAVRVNSSLASANKLAAGGLDGKAIMLEQVVRALQYVENDRASSRTNLSSTGQKRVPVVNTSARIPPKQKRAGEPRFSFLDSLVTHEDREDKAVILHGPLDKTLSERYWNVEWQPVKID